MPLLSIAIPTFNRADILEKALDCILPQINDCKDANLVELIISDNASTDNTTEVIERKLNQYPKVNVSVFRQNHNTGYYGNFKKCRELSKGKYFWLLSDNEHLKNNAIEKVLGILKKDDIGVLFFSDSYDLAIDEKKSLSANDFFKTNSSYKITLISSAIMLNNKKHDRKVFDQYKQNLFLGFLFISNALLIKESVTIANIQIFNKYPASHSFDYFDAWSKDILECLNYMLRNKIVDEEAKSLFISGYMLNNVREHIIKYRLRKGNIDWDRYPSKHKIREKLDSFYPKNKTYIKKVRPLLHLPITTIHVLYYYHRLIKKFKSYIG